MIKIFGSTQYPKTDVSESKIIGNRPDIKPFELYLQLEVKSRWEWDWNTAKSFLIFDWGFSYYVYLRSKENNTTYHFSKRLIENDITEEYREVIDNYLKELDYEH